MIFRITKHLLFTLPKTDFQISLLSQLISTNSCSLMHSILSLSWWTKIHLRQTEVGSNNRNLIYWMAFYIKKNVDCSWEKAFVPIYRSIKHSNTRSGRLTGHLLFLMAFTANGASWTLYSTNDLDKSAIFTVISKDNRRV